MEFKQDAWLDLIAEGKERQVIREVRAFCKKYGTNAMFKKICLISNDYKKWVEEDRLGVNKDASQMSHKVIGDMFEFIQGLCNPSEEQEERNVGINGIMEGIADCCDREEQYGEFIDLLVRRRQQVHVFCIHGDEREDHASLVRRLVGELKDYSVYGVERLEEIRFSLKRCVYENTYKYLFLTKLCKGFHLSKNYLDASSWEELGSIISKRVDCIVVNIRVDHRYFGIEVIKFLEWLIGIFGVVKGMPRIICFVNVLYLTSISIERKALCEKYLNKSPLVTVLPELSSVEYRDIEMWLDDNGLDYEVLDLLKKKGWVKDCVEELSEDTSFPMKKVRKMLKRLIQNFNAGTRAS